MVGSTIAFSWWTILSNLCVTILWLMGEWLSSIWIRGQCWTRSSVFELIGKISCFIHHKSFNPCSHLLPPLGIINWKYSSEINFIFVIHKLINIRSWPHLCFNQCRVIFCLYLHQDAFLKEISCKKLSNLMQENNLRASYKIQIMSHLECIIIGVCVFWVKNEK